MNMSVQATEANHQHSKSCTPGQGIAIRLALAIGLSTMLAMFISGLYFITQL